MPQLYADRDEAGRVLGAAVAAHLHGCPPGDGRAAPLVLALPRGGVPVGRWVAEAVGGHLDLVVARKIGAPWQPEFGLGAVTADGPALLDEELLRRLDLDPAELVPVVERERAEARRRLARYRGGRPAPVVAGRLVVVVDDGLATGATARAALRSLRAAGPAALLLAVPVGAPESVEALRGEADAVICPRRPLDFRAVGYWYRRFDQLADADVDHALAAPAQVTGGPEGGTRCAGPRHGPTAGRASG
jgi:predicted phosphoribosyltransferase